MQRSRTHRLWIVGVALLVGFALLVSLARSGEAERSDYLAIESPDSVKSVEQQDAQSPKRTSTAADFLPLPAFSDPGSASFTPQQAKVEIHATNYGDRMSRDVNGKPVHNDWLVVLHETVGSASSAINTFQTPHYKDLEQTSYHALITLDGTIVYLLPPEKRAYGAGNSVFVGDRGPEAVQTNPDIPSSVNNFAYHISLETPPDGANNQPTHSGYTMAQYESLAWLVARTQVPSNRVVTHAEIDRAGERQDPRSFDFSLFRSLLEIYADPDLPIGSIDPRG